MTEREKEMMAWWYEKGSGQTVESEKVNLCDEKIKRGFGKD